MIRPPILIDSEGHIGFANGLVGSKKEILDQPLLIGRTRCNVGMHGKESKYIQSYSTQCAGDLVSGESDAPANETGGTRSCVWVENLAFQYRSIVAGISLTGGPAKQRREIPCAFGIGRQSGDVGRAFVFSILLPGEKEEALVVSVIKLGNPNRTAQTAAEVVLMIPGFRGAIEVVCPGIRVQLVVAKNVEGGSVKSVGAGLSGEAFDAPGGPAKFRRNCGGRDFEFVHGFDGRSIFIELRTQFGMDDTGSIEEHFGAEGLPAGELRLENTGGATGSGTGTCGPGRQENERFRGAQMALPGSRKSQRKVLNLSLPDDCTDIRTFRLNCRCVGDDRHGILYIANRQSKIQCRYTVDLHLHAGLLFRFETTCSDRDVINADLHILHSISARGPCRRRIFCSVISSTRH